MDPEVRRKITKCITRIRRLTFTEACNEYDVILVDLPSVVYGLKRPVEFLKNISLAQQLGIKSRIVVVLDSWKDIHKKIVEKYVKMLDDLSIEYIVSTDMPAELKAAYKCLEFLNKGEKCIVLSRDYDPLLVVDEELIPSHSGYVWTLDLVKVVDRLCIEMIRR